MLEKILTKQVIGPIGIIIGFSILYLIFRKIIRKVLSKGDKRRQTLIGLFTNLVKYFMIIVALLMILDIYGINTSALITSLGVVGLIGGLALQDILKDFLAGIAIITENQYEIGDIVTINGFKGEVLSLGIKTTKLKSYDGDIKFISNGTITEVINHTISNSLAIINLSISYDEDISRVEKVLNNLFKKLSTEIPELTDEIKLLGVEDLGSSAVIFKIIAETKPMKHYDVARKLRKEIKDELNKHDIVIPYDQLVVHNGL